MINPESNPILVLDFGAQHVGVFACSGFSNPRSLTGSGILIDMTRLLKRIRGLVPYPVWVVVFVVPVLFFMFFWELLSTLTHTKMGQGMFAVEFASLLWSLKCRKPARFFATRALRRVDVVEDDVFSGNICHKAHVLLGHLALESNDEEAACSHLIASTYWGNIHQVRIGLAHALWKRGRVAEVLNFYDDLAEKTPYEEWNKEVKEWVANCRAADDLQ